MNQPRTTRTERLKRALWNKGLDICHGPFCPKLYNDAIAAEGLVESGRLSELPEVVPNNESSNNGSSNNHHEERRCVEAYLIGNTKHLWPYFLEWLQRENEAQRPKDKANDNERETTHPPPVSATDASIPNTATTTTTTTTRRTLWIRDPLDTYERATIESVLQEVSGGWYDCYASSETEDPSRMVSLARVAECTGFSWLDPHTHLSVHPTFGTWHSYRAVVVLAAADDDDEPTAAPRMLSKPPPGGLRIPNPVSPKDTHAARKAFDQALAISSSTVGDEDEDAMDRLSSELGSGDYYGSGAQTTRRRTTMAEAWIAPRDAVTLGRQDYRFGQHQLRYHYTKDPECLWAGIKALPPESSAQSGE